MKVNPGIIKKLANIAQVMNTVNGGTVSPTFKLMNTGDQFEANISIPSINPDSLKVEVDQGHLYVFQNLETKGVLLPYLIGLVKLPSGSSIEQITADFYDQNLIVTIPLADNSSSHRREIQINKF